MGHDGELVVGWKAEANWWRFKKNTEMSRTGRVVANQWENKVRGKHQPRPRSGHTIAVLQNKGLAVMFGGLGDDVGEVTSDPVLNDVWVYNLQEDSWEEISVNGEKPDPVFGHTAEVLETETHGVCMVVFGGQSVAGVLAGDAYILKDLLSSPTWHKLPSSDTILRSSLSRWGHTMVPLHEPGSTISLITGKPVPPEGNLQLIIFGGMAESYESLGDILALDVASLSWSVIDDSASETRPVGRRRHIAAIDPADYCMWVFGGRSEWNSFHSDLWRFDLRSHTWTEVHAANSPLPRTGHCGAMHGSCLYVFGGFELRGPVEGEWDYMIYNDLHQFNTMTREWEEVVPNPVGCAGEMGVHEKGKRASSRQVQNSSTSGSNPQARPVVTWGETGTSKGEETPVETGQSGVHICPDQTKPCVAPRQRSMASCFIYQDRFYLHGGRDKLQAFNCAFSVPLIPTNHCSLVAHVARFLVDEQVQYCDAGLADDLNNYLDSLFAAPV
eukprot:TRINITY_DN2261_c0_g3_i1.p1 TRINITY_DN2261_c0_g3~~TRINITY_DN2261_c0_g3_i1.p1  ORF type:complete len:499 (+),score=64.53 TRINITY_DN2261_c0_g3_i1:118-1614(+)